MEFPASKPLNGSLQLRGYRCVVWTNTFADVIQYNDPNGRIIICAFNVDGEYTEQRINSREINADLMVTLRTTCHHLLKDHLLLG